MYVNYIVPLLNRDSYSFVTFVDPSSALEAIEGKEGTTKMTITVVLYTYIVEQISYGYDKNYCTDIPCRVHALTDVLGF